jgi:acyl dehydratase
MQPRAFEDFQVGQRIRLAEYSLGEAEMVDFALKYDPQPMHTDPEAALDSPFGGLIASGWLTTAVFMRMQYEALIANSLCVASPGVDEIRWLLPVRPGDTLSGECRVRDARPSRSKPDRGAVFCHASIRNQNGEEVMTLTSRTIFLRRGPAKT